VLPFEFAMRAMSSIPGTVYTSTTNLFVNIRRVAAGIAPPPKLAPFWCSFFKRRCVGRFGAAFSKGAE
jgi:hypothetical protein